jgi:hypothetical protein
MSEHLDVLKNNIVTQMFVDTADQNYLIARWAYHRGMFIDFFWNAVHSLEKYLKASLLLNGRSSTKSSYNKNFGHDLRLLFEDVTLYAKTYMPDNLIMPHELDLEHWQEETPIEFLSRFYNLGEANNRYNIFGYTQRWEDLHHFDQMVFYIRRIAFDLNALPLSRTVPLSNNVPQTVGECLARDPSYSPRCSTSRLHKLLTTKGDDELRDAGLKLNFQFAPADYDHFKDGVRLGRSCSESVLYQRIVRQVERGACEYADKETIELANWVINTISLPKPIKNELKNHVRTLKARSP